MVFGKKKSNESSQPEDAPQWVSPDGIPVGPLPFEYGIDEVISRLKKYMDNHVSDITVGAIWKDADFYDAHEAAIELLIKHPSLFAEGGNLRTVTTQLIGRSFMAAMYHSDMRLIEKIKKYTVLIVPGGE